MARAPRALRYLSLNVVVEMDLSLEAVQEIQSAPPSHIPGRGQGPARGRMTRKQMPTTWMEEDGQPNGRKSHTQCPETLIEVSAGIRLDFVAQRGASWSIAMDNVILDNDIVDSFNTPAGIPRTIQPDKIPPRLTRARQRRFELPSAVAQENPPNVEDITAVDCPTLHVHDTMDYVWTPPMRMDTDGLSRVPGLQRWYTKSPPTSRGGDGMPRCHTTPNYGSFSEAKKGHQVLTSQKHIGNQSADITTTYALLYGIVLGDYTDDRTNTPMFVVDYGHPWPQYHIPRSLCDLRPLEAQGSAGTSDVIVGEGESWRGRLQLDFSEAGHTDDNAWDGGNDTTLLGDVTPVCVERRGLRHQFPLPLPVRGEWPLVERRIQGYNKDSLATGTDESTAQKPFPKVTISYPSYLLFDNNVREAPDSSGEEWIGGEEDWATSDDCLEELEDPKGFLGLDGEDRQCGFHSDPVEPFFDSDDANDDCTKIGEMEADENSYKEWSQSSESFKATPLKDKEFERYYHQSNWTSKHITLLGERNNFTSSHLGYVPPRSGPHPY